MNKSGARHRLNRLLGHLGEQLISLEQRAGEQRLHVAQADALADAYEAFALPSLPSRDGRRELLRGLLGTPIPEAMYLVWLLSTTLSDGGDVCEFGVAQGATSALIANEVREHNVCFWMYDSFEGLSKPTDKDVLIDDVFGLGSMDRYANAMAFPRSALDARLDAVSFPHDRRRIIEGYIVHDLDPCLLPQCVSFAYVDFDLYEPIKIALDLLHPRTRAGSVIMVDDFRYFSAGAEAAVEEFLLLHRDEYQLHEPPPAAGKFCWLVRTNTASSDENAVYLQ